MSYLLAARSAAADLHGPRVRVAVHDPPTRGIGLPLGGLVLAPSLDYLFRVFEGAPADEIRSSLGASDQEIQ